MGSLDVLSTGIRCWWKMEWKVYLFYILVEIICLPVSTLITSDDETAEVDLVEAWVTMEKMELSAEKHAQKGFMGYSVRFGAAFVKLGFLGA